MFLLRSEGGVAIENNCLFSKFHYVSIKIVIVFTQIHIARISKFHYVSIKIFPAHTSLHPGIHSKFHYVSIKMQGRRRGNYPGTGSKFHYVSIKMANRTNQYKGAKATLNSTMFLLRSPLRPFKIPSLIPLNSTMFLLR